MLLKTKSKLCFNFLRILIFILGIPSLDLIAQNKILRFEHLTVKEGLAQNGVNAITKDKYGFMWFATWEGLSKYDGYKFYNYNANNSSNALSNNRINQLYKDMDENIWFLAFDTMIFRYNYETDDFTKFTKHNAPKAIVDSLIWPQTIFYTFVKKSDYTWLAYRSDKVITKNISVSKIDNSLVQINRKSGKEFLYRENPLNNSAINNNYIFCIYSDNNEMFWVGTNGGGVNKADLRQKQFNLYQHSVLDKNTIVSNAIRAICEDKNGNLWVGTNQEGLTKFNRTLNKCTHYQFNPHDTINSLISNQVRMIFCDRYGYVWLGTKGGLDRLNPENNQFCHYAQNLKHNIPDNSVFWIIEDYSGYLWIGTMNGIAKYDRRNNKFFAYRTNYFPKQQRVRIISFDRKNNIWIATDGGGLLHLQRDTSAGFKEKISFIAQYRHLQQNPNSLSDNRIYAMLEDEKGFLWLGTGSGLDRFDPEKKTFKHFNKQNGFPDELIVSILSDKKGNVWIGHKRGITKLNTTTYKIRNYTQSDGLQDNEFSEDAYFRNERTGELFFGGVNGVNAFFPDSIKDNPYLPKIVFTNLKVSNIEVGINQLINGRIILHKPLYLTKSISLTRQDRSITIEFAALHYSNPANNKYAYMLEGFDKDWIYTDAFIRIATYSNLEPHTYVFKVRASNNDGLWNPVPIELEIIVVPPWWKTWWFKLIILLAFMLSVYISFYVRVELYRKKERELSMLVKKRTQEISKANEILLERQTRIEEYTEELHIHTENLKEANELLLSKQTLIETQAELLNESNQQLNESNQQLNESNQQLAILNSTKDRFFSIIAHDLRNPFHTVRGFTEILIKDYKKLPFEKIERFLNLIYASSASGSNLLENLLQWSRSQTGRITFDPTKLNLSAIADETVNLLEGNAIRKNITMHSLVDQDIIVLADENMLKTIFRNLISNAIKFTPENGAVKITSSLGDSQVSITVADTGVGILPEDIPKLFRIDTNITTKGTSNETGTGLGLILCKEFIEKHKGEIWVESEINKGSEFKFTLPLG